MLILNIQDNMLEFKSISKSDLPQILKWYNNTNDYKFATGIDTPITLDDLYHKYAEVLMCRHEFFIAIYLKGHGECIGVVRGGVNSKSRNALWINSIVIDNNYQNQGYGTKVVELLMDYFMKYSKIHKSYISVVDRNNRAKAFWRKLGFIELRKIDTQITLDNEKHNVIIMERELNKERMVG